MNSTGDLGRVGLGFTRNFFETLKCNVMPNYQRVLNRSRSEQVTSGRSPEVTLRFGRHQAKRSRRMYKDRSDDPS